MLRPISHQLATIWLLPKINHSQIHNGDLRTICKLCFRRECELFCLWHLMFIDRFMARMRCYWTWVCARWTTRGEMRELCESWSLFWVCDRRWCWPYDRFLQVCIEIFEGWCWLCVWLSCWAYPRYFSCCIFFV